MHPLRVVRRAILALAAIVFAASASLAVGGNVSTKTLHVAFPVAETGFDPQAAGDAYSNYVNRAIFDPLYRYDYLARPYRLVPNTATALPEITDDGKTWTIHIRKGIYFADDPAFHGKRRELTAADYVYAIKRILDPKMRSNSLQMVDGRFVGADAVVAKARETGHFDYDAPIEGLQATDRYTLRFRLVFADYELLSNLTTSATAGVAREAIEAYRDGNGWAMANPVGTGAYRLKDWRRAQRIVLEANPGYRDERYPTPSSAADRALAKGLAGRRLPLVPNVEISIIEEAQPRLLAFRQKQLDFTAVPVNLVNNVLDADNRLKPEFANAGIRLERAIQPAISYMYFNMEDPVVGGYTPDRIALRRAISLGYDAKEEIRVLRQNQGLPATQVVPPNMSGHDPSYDGRLKYDPAAAKALLDRFGYVDRNGDGFRELPDGKPLLLHVGSGTTEQDREFEELWKRCLNNLGIRVDFVKQKWPDMLKMARLGQLQMWQLGNINTTPDGFGFYGLLYGRNAGFSNLARFALPEYDRLYEKARAMPDSSERLAVERKMSELVNAYAPWVLTAFRYENVLVQPWLRGYKYNPTYQYPFAYLDVDHGGGGGSGEAAAESPSAGKDAS
ncbi:MAG TPA: ABC transporter substrate-binding protein [Casimicrobiaceae bacterium]|nr:ABC transporter substrate-binding protein [Casimicrobiaceae bacterium]